MMGAWGEGTDGRARGATLGQGSLAVACCWGAGGYPQSVAIPRATYPTPLHAALCSLRASIADFLAS